jgi:hypothetical protein
MNYRVLAFILLCFNFSVKQAYAQRPQILFSGDKSLARGKSDTLFFPLHEGDSVFIELTGPKNKVFSVEFSDWGSPATLRRIVENKASIPTLAGFTEVYQLILHSEAKKTFTANLTVSRKSQTRFHESFAPKIRWGIGDDTTFKLTYKQVVVQMDTVPVKLISSTVPVASRTAWGVQPRVTIPIELPENTLFWTYWIGVGQEAHEALRKLTLMIPKSAQLLGVIDPVTAFGLGVIKELPLLAQGEDVTIHFIATSDEEQFIKGEPVKGITGGQPIRAVTDFRTKKWAPSLPKSMILALENDNYVVGISARVEIVAFELLPRYGLKSIREPLSIKKVFRPMIQ